MLEIPDGPLLRFANRLLDSVDRLLRDNWKREEELADKLFKIADALLATANRKQPAPPFSSVYPSEFSPTTSPSDNDEKWEPLKGPLEAILKTLDLEEFDELVDYANKIWLRVGRGNSPKSGAVSTTDPC
jgi:hypothetical protein